MDFEYGIRIPTILLGVAVAIWAISDAIRQKRYYRRYALIFSAAFCDILGALVRLIALATQRPSRQVGNVFEMYFPFQAVYAAAFFVHLSTIIQQYFFFEVCRTIITSQAATDSSAAPIKRPAKLSATYLAAAWSIILVIFDIAFRGVLSSNFYFRTSTSDILLYISTCGGWAYLVFSAIQIYMGHQELRPCMSSLGGYVVFMTIVNIGATASTIIENQDSTAAILEFVLVHITGLIALFYALWTLPRYWIPNPEWYKPKQQPYYYVPATMAGIPQQQPMPASQYPVVQLPQQQLQPGQYPIVQLPLSQQQTDQQYPVVQVQYVTNPPPPQHV